MKIVSKKETAQQSMGQHMLMENIYNENELNIELIYNMQTDLVSFVFCISY